MQVITLHALADNCVFGLRHEDEVTVVDPGEAGPVLEYLDREPARLTAILNTHHHADHLGGNRALLARFPDAVVYGSAADRGRIPGQTRALSDGDEVATGAGGATRLPASTVSTSPSGLPMGRRRGEDLRGEDEVVLLEQPRRARNRAEVVAEIWRRGERFGPPDGSLVGLRYRLAPQVCVDALRMGAKIWREDGEVFLEPDEGPFVSALLAVVTVAVRRRRRNRWGSTR